MGAIRTNAAAAMLGVSPSTLRSWERRFGYPEPRRSAGGHRQFDLGEIEALRAAFQETQNVSSAITLARERGAGPACPSRLRGALQRFDEGEADRVLEESLAVRSVERSVEEVLLPAGIAALDARDRPRGGFAWRWATGWLAAAKRVAPPASREEAVLIFDSSAPGTPTACTPRRSSSRSVAAACARSRSVPPSTTSGWPARCTPSARASSCSPGRHASLDALARLVYTARARRHPRRGVRLPRRAPRDRREHGRAPRRKPLAAAERIVAVVDGRPAELPPHAARREHLTHRVRPLRDDRPRR